MLLLLFLFLCCFTLTVHFCANSYCVTVVVLSIVIRQDFAATLKGVSSNIRDAFPDFQANAFGFSCDDPVEPMRVWYFVRPRGSFTGDFKDPFGRVVKATGKKLIGPPEVSSVAHTNCYCTVLSDPLLRWNCVIGPIDGVRRARENQAHNRWLRH